MADNFTKLARTINRRIQSVAAGKIEVTAELGEIVSGQALKVSSLDEKIPRSEYSVIGYGNYVKGDDVLVVWASGEPVIVGKVE